MSRAENRRSAPNMCRDDLPVYLAALDDIAAKWVAEEDQLKSELKSLSRWRFHRRSVIRAELRTINWGMLKLLTEQIDVQFRVASGE